ncbi:S8 family serine peptidase [Flavobacterium microcysteis]|uniref:T9SS type A sorting domain-containing protein n=1 Tax=Flavobacterium microcysteis TaxID=2596891 RepID=A0A501QIR5_9FLAO|nr:S8 family serine peptidase [Flavobacterium microcysteis]TPD72035.1 T9SS type A sorting domain-containing protein [Flavobacterium microcysteis]
MTKNSTSAFKALSLLFLFSIPFTGFSQDKNDIEQITKNYDLKKLKELQEVYRKKSASEKRQALKAAKLNNWPEFIKNENGTVDELMKLTPDGFPLYYSVNNRNAARSTRASFLNTGGSLGLNLDGQGMVARVWDGGKVRASHREFGGRITVNDAVASSSGNNFHATHVTGTIAATGITPNAKGMAPLAQVRTFNWTDDESEALAEIQSGMLLSNHSYGVPIVNNGQFAPSWYIGAYTTDARAWDEIAYNAPYYLMVASAGNNGEDQNPQPMALGYDKLTGNKTAKNNLVVANAEDAVILSDGTLANVTINTGSSQGPTDDFRVKPDITGNGTSLYSTFETSDSAYGTLSGTSMASPNVTGTLLLLQQYYKIKNKHFMKAATLKALACHTADDVGSTGPDAIYGWGLLNAKKAAETITANGLGTVISEEMLQQGQTFTMTVNSNGIEPLEATIAWTDVPGRVNNGVLNSPTPVLVNDLDIRITKGTSTYFPWRLTSDPNSNAANDGDNKVDNIEKISILAAAGTYTITVTHKGTLARGPQNFSLIVTGVNSTFALAPLSEDQTVCSNSTAVYNFQHTTTTSQNTNFTIVGLPAGVSGNLSTTSSSINEALTMTLSNLNTIPAGDYTIGIRGTRGTDIETKYVNLKIYTDTFQNSTLLSPANNITGMAPSLRLEWEPSINAESYILQVATDTGFGNLIVNQEVTETNYFLNSLTPEHNYYWRVLPKNRCATATTSTVYNFQTGALNCGQAFYATDFSDGTIATTANAIGSVPILVTGGMTVGNLTATISISHSYIEDITVYLEGPETIGSPLIKLFEEPCGDNDDILATVSDAGVPFTCGATSPSITGTVRPLEPLSNFSNIPADGVWTLYVLDKYNGDGGFINNFSLSFCNVTPSSLSVADNQLANISVYPNPSKGILNVSLPANTGKTTLHLNDIQGRRILTKETSNTNEVLNIDNFSDGVYILTIENGALKTTKKIILNR